MSTFNLFVYGTLRARERGAPMLDDCERIGSGSVHGTLYDIEGRLPALVLYGETEVSGEVWRCPAAMLLQLDDYEGVGEGVFRRAAVSVTDAAGGPDIPCWTYLAGPALARQLTPDRRRRGSTR